MRRDYQAIAVFVCLFAFFCVSFGTGITSATEAGRTRVFIMSPEAFNSIILHRSNLDSPDKAVDLMDPEYVSALNKACPEITITNNLDRADFIIAWGWKSQRNQFGVYHPSGDLMGSGTTMRVTNAAKDICVILRKAKK